MDAEQTDEAEIEEKTCYVFYEGFRPQEPDCAEPNGDGRVPVPRRLVVVSLCAQRCKAFAVSWRGVEDVAPYGQDFLR